MSSCSGSASTSLSLVERVRRFDAEAWQRLCDVYGPLVYRWSRARGLQATDAADVGQEVFRTVAARIGEFRCDRPGDTFRGWLWTITHHKLGDHFRRLNDRPQAVGGTTAHLQMNEQADDLSVELSPADSDVAEREVLHRVLAQIRLEFERTTWEAFWRTTVDGRPTDLAAAELGLTPGAVRQAKYRVLKRFRAEMQDERRG